MQSNAKGSVLAYSLIILSVMLLIAISLSAVTLTQTKSSLTGQNSSQAFQTADSGVQVVLKKIKKAQPTANVNSIGCSGAGIITGSLSAGTYEVQLYEYDSSSGADVPMGDCSASVGDISKIKSVGKYAGTARAVEVAVAAGGLQNVHVGTSVSNTSSYTYTYPGSKEPLFLYASAHLTAFGSANSYIEARWLDSSNNEIESWQRIVGINQSGAGDGGAGLNDTFMMVIPFFPNVKKIEFRSVGANVSRLDVIAYTEQ